MTKPTVSPGAEFSVEAKFYLLPQDEWRLVDLDNLAEVLLDSLFRPRHPASVGLTSPLFDADDGQVVVELILRKTVVHKAKDQGVDVRVTWAEGGAGRPSFR